MNTSHFIKIVKRKKHLSSKIRLYLIDKDNHYFINNGVIKRGFDSQIFITKNRDSVLSGFSKMAFLFDEIIRLRIVQYSDDRDGAELLYILNLVPINRKIRAFLDWNVFCPEFTRDMSRLFEVRNDTVHCISLDEVTYTPQRSMSLSSNSGFKKFVSDFQKSWKVLLEIYIQQQEKINWKKLEKEI
ncbi:MAG: hypothetical protein COW27_02875 [Nitrosopumilales archaeon CG15_BIG_FIL_POST_REV_8_21_14_020_37_12]|nr:MAG: hypothetical protein COW27_02875 [Nitrosopumilales archaeon CG15_BIG_FIL_POST_REV_8_21_14_020_37_12]